MNRQFKVAFYLCSGYKTKDGKVPVIAQQRAYDTWLGWGQRESKPVGSKGWPLKRS